MKNNLNQYIATEYENLKSLFGYGYSLWAEQSLDAVRIYPSEPAGLVPGSPKQHERSEKPGFYGNMQIRERYHAVKDVPGYGKILHKRLLCGRGYGFGLYCGYPEDESTLIHNQKRKNCAADYLAGKLGRTVGI